MSRTDEAWTEVAEQLRELGVTVKDHWDAQATRVPTESVSQDEVKDALKTLGDSLSAAFGAVGAAFRDPEVTTEVKETASSFFGALGVTFSEIGADIAGGQGDESAGMATDQTSPDVATPDPSEDE